MVTYETSSLESPCAVAVRQQHPPNLGADWDVDPEEGNGATSPPALRAPNQPRTATAGTQPSSQATLASRSVCSWLFCGKQIEVGGSFQLLSQVRWDCQSIVNYDSSSY